MNPDQIAQLLLTIFNGLQAQQPAGAQPPALNQATLQPILAAVAKLLAAQGGTPAAAAAAPPPPQAPTASSPSAVSNPSVQIGALGLAITSFLQAIGTIAPPFSSVFHTASTTTPTTIATDPMVGTLATVIPLIVAGLGATGGWGSLLGIASSLIGAIGNAAKKSP
jgi:hypothetical protein